MWGFLASGSLKITSIKIIPVPMLLFSSLFLSFLPILTALAVSYKIIGKAISIGYRFPGPFSMNKRNYKRLSKKLEEVAEITGKSYLKPCELMKSGEFLKMR